jgi:hypothetical protein
MNPRPELHRRDGGFSLVLPIVAPGTGPGVGCPDGSTLTFDGLIATDAFNQASALLAFKRTGATLHRTSNDPVVNYDLTYLLTSLN